MYDIIFLILNYHSIDELHECLDSISKHCDNCNFAAVIVDNGSDNSEVQQLETLRSNYENIILLKSETNLGFARGNNLGFRYIKKHMQCKFVAMINSDTLLVSSDFYVKLCEAYSSYKFAVLGPDILNAHSNPMIDEPDCTEKVLKEIRKMCSIRTVMRTPGINFAYLIANKLKNKRIFSTKRISEVKLGCELHGCFLVFSELFTLDGLCDDTFLYGEEAILAKDCRDNHLTLLYYPEIKIIHNESIATKRNVPNLIKRKLFYLDNYIDSLYVLLKKYER